MTSYYITPAAVLADHEEQRQCWREGLQHSIRRVLDSWPVGAHARRVEVEEHQAEFVLAEIKKLGAAGWDASFDSCRDGIIIKWPPPEVSDAV